MGRRFSTSSATRERDRERGFTLLEVLVAVVILGIVLLTVYGTVSRTISTKEYAEERAQLASVGREAVLRIGDEIEAALSPATWPGVVFQGVSSGEADDQVRFALSVDPPFGPIGALGASGGEVLVTYGLDFPEGNPPRFALRRDQVPLRALVGLDEEEVAEQEEELAFSVLLAQNVAGLRFRYLDGESRQWLEEWDSTREEFLGRLPLAVEVALYLYDGAGNIHEFATIVDLPLANFRPTPESG